MKRKLLAFLFHERIKVLWLFVRFHVHFSLLSLLFLAPLSSFFFFLHFVFLSCILLRDSILQKLCFCFRVLHYIPADSVSFFFFFVYLILCKRSTTRTLCLKKKSEDRDFLFFLVHKSSFSHLLVLSTRLSKTSLKAALATFVKAKWSFLRRPLLITSSDHVFLPLLLGH